ncbi:MAG: DUF4390 domain-containing protein [Gammaproteobacteria bacterium]|nr:DUF4390 domain-containing protein [Gammaproteobacteria bacterium]
MPRLNSRLAALCVAVALASAVLAGTREAGFHVRGARVELVNDIYMVDVQFEHRFSEESLEALENGIPLTVNVEVEFRRPRRYLWDPLVVRVVQDYRLQRHELSNQYLVIDVATGGRRNFGSLEAAIAALDAPAPIPVAERDVLSGGHEYVARVRTRMDIEALPAPLRPVAWLKPGWRLASDWLDWVFET